MKPFPVIANIYYVGYYVAPREPAPSSSPCPRGLILTDGGLPESAQQGFDLKNVKILLNSHAHFDYAGALARLKRDSGARLVASEADKPFLEKGLISFGPSVADPLPPVTVDRTVKDGDTVSLSGVTLTAPRSPVFPPPAPPGPCRSPTATRPNNQAYPAIASDYKATFAKLKTMDADIFLAPHGEQFGLTRKLAAMQNNAGIAGRPTPSSTRPNFTASWRFRKNSSTPNWRSRQPPPTEQAMRYWRKIRLPARHAYRMGQDARGAAGDRLYQHSLHRRGACLSW